MEQKLLIVGIIAFIFAKLSKYLKSKKLFENTKIFAFWNAAFALIAGTLAFYLLNFMAKNGLEGGLSSTKFSLILTATVAAIWYLCSKALKAKKKEKEKLYAFNLDWAETIYFAAFFASIVMFFFAQAFKIPSPSMRNTLIEGDNLFINKITYGIRLPFMNERLVKFNDIKRGEVIVFKFPAEDENQRNCGDYQYGRDFVKRVIALPGETVQVKNRQVFINGKLQEPKDYAIFQDHSFLSAPDTLSKEQYQEFWENRNLEEYLGNYLRDDFGPVTVPQGSYFAMGDNRDASCDSRFWGPVPEKNIKGKVWFIHWPLSRIKLIK